MVSFAEMQRRDVEATINPETTKNVLLKPANKKKKNFEPPSNKNF